ncbi:MAG: anhydro-N-acetylmuramic acid kinase [Alcanivorax sp.]
MEKDKVYRAIGLMSGTSLDGEIDVALIETDGRNFVRPLRYMAHPYDISVRDKVRACFGKISRDAAVEEAESLVTQLHIDAVKAFGEHADVIGFHGQTITHDPDNKFTWQIGDGQALAEATGINVVADLRQADIKAGGQGAPLLPLYHQALLSDHDKPVAVLNLGGVANITYVGSQGDLIAFDCGPANAMMDDLMLTRTGKEFDEGGKVAAKGEVQHHLVKTFLSHPFFKKAPPKSLDRNQWSIDCVRYCENEDAMATLLEMSVCAILNALDYLPQKPTHIYAAGGGRKNKLFVDSIVQHLHIPVTSIDDIGWNGDATEAEGFAYLAVRSILGESVTVPSTTGAPKPMTGGVLYPARNTSEMIAE